MKTKIEDLKFAEELDDINICSEKKYTEEHKIDTEETNSIPAELIGMGPLIKVGKQDEAPNRTGIGVLKTTEVKTNNSFINITQQKEKERQRKEEIELKNADVEFPYVATKLMTDAESQLFYFMRENLCQVERIEIFPKVRLADIVNVDNRITTDSKYLWKITNKHVDFLICKREDLSVICVVELDDYTHENKEAQEKDIFIMQTLYAANIRTVRIRTKIRTIERKDLALIDDYINTALAPKCPECGRPMIPRRDRHGMRFYAGSDYDNCRYTISIDSQGEKLP